MLEGSKYALERNVLGMRGEVNPASVLRKNVVRERLIEGICAYHP
jgi:hypothetical protein